MPASKIIAIVVVVSPKKRASLIIVTAVWCSAARPPETAE